MFYAGYCAYGTNIAVSSLNGGAWRFFAFPTKRQRTEFLDKHTYDNCNNIVATSISAREIRKIVGSKYVLESMFSDIYSNEIYRHDFYELEFDRSRLLYCVIGWSYSNLFFL